MKTTENPIPVLIVIGTLASAFGALMLFFPRTVRKYDMRMTLWIKDEASYIAFTRVFGALFLRLGLLIFTGIILALTLTWD